MAGLLSEAWKAELSNGASAASTQPKGSDALKRIARGLERPEQDA